jgi:hypothetical protein
MKHRSLEPRRVRQVDGAIITLLTLAALAIGTSQAINSDLWFDEVYSVSVSLLPLKHMWPIVLREGGNMWGYMLLLRPLQLLPHREYTYEFPSIALGAVAVAIQYRLLRKFSRVAIATLFASAFLVSLSVSQLSEVRSYASAIVILQLIMIRFVDQQASRRTGPASFLLLLVAPVFHLLLIFPCGLLALAIVRDAWKSRIWRVMWPIAGLVVTTAFLAFVNLKNPAGASPVAWLKEATLTETVAQVLVILERAVPGPSSRFPLTGFAVILVLVGAGLGTRQVHGELARYVMFSSAIALTLAAAGLVTNGFLALPDRYGLFLLPGFNIVAGALTEQGWANIAPRSRQWSLLLGGLATVIFGIAQVDRLNNYVDYNHVVQGKQFSARGSSAFQLLLRDDPKLKRTDTLYVISPGVRLELMTWLRLHPSTNSRAITSRLPAFDVAELAQDSPFITKEWMGHGVLRSGVTRVAVLDFSTGCHAPATSVLAAALGNNAAKIDVSTIGGYSLSSFTTAQTNTASTRVMNGTCGLSVTLPRTPA